MIKENASFLTCAGSIETRATQFYKSPFVFSSEDKLILVDSDKRKALTQAVSRLSTPVFIIEYNPFNSNAPLQKVARMDAYILTLALLIYSIRLKINTEGDSERFLWTCSEETFAFLSDIDSETLIDSLIRHEISIRPVISLSEIINGRWESSGPESHKIMARYLQMRYSHWRAA